MKHHIYNFLKEYSTDPLKIDRLLISCFIKTNNITIVNNILLREYLITNHHVDEYRTLENFEVLVNENLSEFTFELLIELFEFVVAPADRIINGAVYTPKYIRDYIVTQTFSLHGCNFEEAKIADISCGCGGFLYTASKLIKEYTGLTYSDIFDNNIYGIDIQEHSITRTKLLLSLLAVKNGEDLLKFNFNLYANDSLVFNWKETLVNFAGFSIIIGNPPYVRLRNLSEETKMRIKKWKVSSTGLTDLYIPFFEIGIENLHENGILGYITMNSFFKSLNGRALRHYFQLNKYQFRIIDFGSTQIFKSKNTYTCICIIQKKEADLIEYKKITNTALNDNAEYSRINYEVLDSQKGWNLKDYKEANKIETTGTPFGKKYRTRHGIATLKNKVYIFKPIKEDSDFYYLKDKNTSKEYPIEKYICKDIINSNRINGIKSLEEIKEKIIFPYTYDNNKRAIIIDEDVFKEKYPSAHSYLEERKEILAKRDKGKGKYPTWYAFGRTQSLEKIVNKLFFPKISNRPPTTFIDGDENLFYYNGQAIIEQNVEELTIIQKLIESNTFWDYIVNTSKPYSSDYYSLNGNYISNFGVCDLSPLERKYLLSETDKNLVNAFFEKKYK